MQWEKQKNGFTIVELLIVIVVIAILAAITVVAYNGIQERAWNSRAVANANTMQKVLMAYQSEHGRYPDYSGIAGNEQVCLGGTSGGRQQAGHSAGSNLRRPGGPGRARWGAARSS